MTAGKTSGGRTCRPGLQRRAWRLALALATSTLVLATGASPAWAWGPPGWWGGWVKAGAPNWVPEDPQSPPLEVGHTKRGWSPKPYASWFHGELLRTAAEEVALKQELGALGREYGAEVGKLAVQQLVTLVVEHGLVYCPELGIPVIAEDLHTAYEVFERVKVGTNGLNVIEKLSLLRADEQYLRWLSSWYARYDPGAYMHRKQSASVIWNGTRSWERNPRSPYNRDRATLAQAVKLLKEPCCRDAADMGRGSRARLAAACSPYALSVGTTGIDFTTTDHDGSIRDLGAGDGYVTVTTASGQTLDAGTCPQCGQTSDQSLPPGATVTLHAYANQDSTFQGWDVSGGSGCQQGSSVCQIRLTGDTSVRARFAVKTYVLTVHNQAADQGIATGGGTGISCGTTAGTLYEDCTAVERAYRFVEISVFPQRPDPKTDQSYQIAQLSCGEGESSVATDRDSGWCRFTSSESDQTINVSWAPESGGAA